MYRLGYGQAWFVLINEDGKFFTLFKKKCRMERGAEAHQLVEPNACMGDNK
jgi:hypothetical protein